MWISWIYTQKENLGIQSVISLTKSDLPSLLSHISMYNDTMFLLFHLIHVAEMLSLLNFCHLTGVMYVRISHLYQISFMLLLIVLF